jgi:hypothetical protein
MHVETVAIPGNLQTVEAGEKSLCDTVIGSGLFPVVKGYFPYGTATAELPLRSVGGVTSCEALPRTYS